MNGRSSAREGQASVVPADGHVHFYGSHDLPRVLEFASRAFVASTPPGAPTTEEALLGVLCLTEDADHSVFEELASGHRRLAGFALHETGEAESRIVETPEGHRLLILSGYQVVTKEGLELLALATRQRPRDGCSLEETAREASESGGLPVLPWALGKWWSGRGRVLLRYLEQEGRPTVYLGDNGGRPQGLPGPEPFTLAARLGLVVLPGSDPLPLGGHEERVGGYGFLLPRPVDLTAPARWFRESVARLPASPPVYGVRSGWGRCLSDQLRLRTRSRVRTPRGEGRSR